MTEYRAVERREDRLECYICGGPASTNGRRLIFIDTYNIVAHCACLPTRLVRNLLDKMNQGH